MRRRLPPHRPPQARHAASAIVWRRPAVRCPSKWGSGGNVDFLSQWTYSYPDPVRIGLCTDELFEMARAGGHDPVRLRLELLPKDSRLRGTLERAKKEWGWPRKLEPGRGQGTASHSSFGSHVTMMAEVSVGDDGWPRVHEVLCVVDCGPVVHPDGLNSQIQGVVGFALSALMREEITIKNGSVQQSNFDDYPPLRLKEMPDVTVITIDSEDDIGGIGEPGYPPLGPAVLNALFDATGQRVRKLPIAGNFKG